MEELPRLLGAAPPSRLVVLSAILPPASPDLAGISPKHTHGFKTRIKTNGSLLQWSSALTGRNLSPVGGAPALPATSVDACVPPRSSTSSWMRRG